MKIYISLDMEGIPGTFNWEQEQKDRAGVILAIKKHLESVIEGIKKSPQNAEITDIVIADSHSRGDNVPWILSELDERISIISGSPRPYYMMPNFSKEYDRVFLIGYHAGTGALRGNMDHTYSNSRVHRITVNGMIMNEALLNSAFANYFGVPVVLVTGDLTLMNEMKSEDGMPWVECVVTKEAVSKFSAMNYSVEKVKKSTIEGVLKALSIPRHEIPLLVFEHPIDLRIEFNSSSYADMASMIPHANRLDGRTVQYIDPDYAVIFETVMALVTMAYTVNP